jgi:hypothetical protein
VRRLAVALLTAVAIASACGGDTTNAGTTTSTTPEPTITTSTTTAAPTTAAPTTVPESSTTTTTTTEPATTGEWVVHDADGCVCADGSDYQYLTWAGDPDKVVIFLQGGGACFTAETCEIGGPAQSFSHDIVADLEAARSGGFRRGLFDFDNPENPVGDWSVIYLPYCTGDVFLGTRAHTYSDEVTISHTGNLNARKGVEHLLANHPGATHVFVTGSSAGAVPAPLVAGLVAEQYPDADVAALGDGAGGYGANPVVMGFLNAQWGIADGIPDWSVADGIDVTTLGAPDNYILAVNQFDNLRVARFDDAYDSVQAGFASLFSLSGGGTVLDVVLESEAYIEQAGIDLPVFIAAGNDHTTMLAEDFYELEEGGVRWVDWLTDFITGEPLDDVKCTDCGSPSS